MGCGRVLSFPPGIIRAFSFPLGRVSRGHEEGPLGEIETDDFRLDSHQAFTASGQLSRRVDAGSSLPVWGKRPFLPVERSSEANA